MALKDLGDLPEKKITKSVKCVATVDFKTGIRTFIFDKTSDYEQDGHFVKKINATDVTISRDDIKALESYMMPGISICKDGEQPTMMSKKYFDGVIDA